MQYTSSEIAAWKKVSHFFEPNNVLDLDACRTYLQTFLKRPVYDAHINEDECNGVVALLKKAVDLPESGAAFARLYNAIRRESSSFQSCLSALSESHPHVLSQWLQSASVKADITTQIMLLRDVKEWLPNDDVGRYINTATLKMNPAVFVKKFTPNVCDMQYLLAVGQEFQKQPKYSGFGLTMVQGIFIAMYGKDCVTNNFDGTGSNNKPPLLEKKYSARAAFGLMQKNGISIEPRKLIQLVKLRYNAESLASDALAYCYDSLDSSATTEKRMYGLAVLDAVLDEQSKAPGPQYNEGLFYIYTILKNENFTSNKIFLKRIESALLNHIASYAKPAATFALAVQHAPTLAETFLDALQERIQDNNNQQLLGSLYFSYRANSLYYGLATFDSYEALQRLVQKKTTPEQVTQAFSHSFDHIVQDASNKGNTSILAYLRHSISAFSISAWPVDKLAHLKESNMVPKWVLTTLFLSTTLPKIIMSEASGLPEINQDPLPFLRMLYPEHSALWNTMLKSILVNDPNDFESYTKQHQQLFNILSSTFLPGKPTLSDIMSISESMGMTCIDYVVAACEKAHALELPNLDGTMFELAP